MSAWGWPQFWFAGVYATGFIVMFTNLAISDDSAVRARSILGIALCAIGLYALHVAGFWTP